MMAGQGKPVKSRRGPRHCIRGRKRKNHWGACPGKVRWRKIREPGDRLCVVVTQNLRGDAEMETKMLPTLLIALCVVLRIVPHPPNFAPVGASAVFAGRTLKPWMALSLIALAMFSGDAILAWVHGYPL